MFIKVRSLKRFSRGKGTPPTHIGIRNPDLKKFFIPFFPSTHWKENGRFQSDCNRENKSPTTYFEKYNGKHSDNDKNFSSKSSIILRRFVEIGELKEENERRRNRLEKGPERVKTFAYMRKGSIDRIIFHLLENNINVGRKLDDEDQSNHVQNRKNEPQEKEGSKSYPFLAQDLLHRSHVDQLLSLWTTRENEE